MQRTWSEGAHDTEIRGGLTAYHPKLDVYKRQVIRTAVTHNTY